MNLIDAHHMLKVRELPPDGALLFESELEGNDCRAGYFYFALSSQQEIKLRDFLNDRAAAREHGGKNELRS